MTTYRNSNNNNNNKIVPSDTKNTKLSKSLYVLADTESMNNTAFKIKANYYTINLDYQVFISYMKVSRIYKYSRLFDTNLYVFKILHLHLVSIYILK